MVAQTNETSKEVKSHTGTRATLHSNTMCTLGLDRYRAGTRYPILLAAAVPIPILEMMSP